MRAYARAAAVLAAAVMSVGITSGCSSSSTEKATPKASRAAEAAPVVEEDTPADKPPSIAPTPAKLDVGASAEFTVADMNDKALTTTMAVKVDAAKYVTPAEIDTTTEPELGRFVRLTLTIKNIGKRPGTIMSAGAVKWEDAKHAPQDATTSESVDGPDLDTEYAPGQSVTGSLILDVSSRGGTVSYYDDPSGPAFSVTLPK